MGFKVLRNTIMVGLSILFIGCASQPSKPLTQAEKERQLFVEENGYKGDKPKWIDTPTEYKDADKYMFLTIGSQQYTDISDNKLSFMSKRAISNAQEEVSNNLSSKIKNVLIKKLKYDFKNGKISGVANKNENFERYIDENTKIETDNLIVGLIKITQTVGKNGTLYVLMGLQPNYAIRWAKNNNLDIGEYEEIFDKKHDKNIAEAKKILGK